MSKYADLDAQIVESIKNGKSDRYAIFCDGAGSEAIKVLVGWRDDAQKLVRRRLTALRKQGVISYTYADGWQISEKDAP